MISLTYQLSTFGPALSCHIRADRHTRLRAGLSQPHTHRPETAGSPLHRWDSFLYRPLINSRTASEKEGLLHTCPGAAWQWQHMPSHHLFNSYKCPKIWAPYHLDN